MTPGNSGPSVQSRARRLWRISSFTDRSAFAGTPNGDFFRSPSVFGNAVTATSVGDADFHQVVVEHRAVPHVGFALRCRMVRVRAVSGELAPPDRRRPGHTLADRLLDARDGGEGATIVVYHDAHTRSDRATLGIRRMQQT